MNAQSFREFPDPVVAAYLNTVRGLSDDKFRILNGLPERRLIRWNDPVTWVLAPIAGWIELKMRVLRWAMRRIGTGGCNDPEALREYKIFWAQLAHRGAGRSAEMRVAMGLLAVRSRDLVAESPQKYAQHMSALVPAASLGWTVGEASA